MRKLSSIVVWIFAIFGAFCMFFLLVGLFGAAHMAVRPPVVPNNVVLRVDLDRDYVESVNEDPIQNLVGGSVPLTGGVQGPSFTKLIITIRHAALDPRVKGLVARVGGTSLGLAQIQEVRDALQLFRAHGKFAYAYGESYGDIDNGTAAYYLASAFDQIWIQPAGAVGITGIDLQAFFVHGTLDKLGVTADFSRRGQYKSAETQLTQTKFPDTDKQALQDMTQHLFDQAVSGIAAGRGLTPDAVRQLIDGAPYTADEALTRHLVDHIGYEDEVGTAAEAKGGSDSLVDVDRYAAAVDAESSDHGPMMSLAGSVSCQPFAGCPPVRGPKIALIYAVGEIDSGSGNGKNVGSDDLVSTLKKASEDASVRAIVLRIDSPGGSEGASESIWRGVMRARAAGKPVIVSMGDEAASGGYYIAAAADRIVAEPATLTGSIGVFGGKFNLNGLWSRLGVSWDGVSLGHNAGIGSSNANFSPDQQARFEALLDDGYHTFISRVSAGRHLTPDAVTSIAGGHVWTGEEAKANSLVDALGGIDTAFELARQAAHLPEADYVPLVAFPRQRSLGEEIQDRLAGGDSASAQYLMSAQQASLMQQILHRLMLAADPSGQSALAPEFVVNR